jgi:hypothetical protein
MPLAVHAKKERQVITSRITSLLATRMICGWGRDLVITSQDYPSLRKRHYVNLPFVDEDKKGGGCGGGRSGEKN